MKKMNKKGDISTLILVIGVFLVCAVAIFNFAFFNNLNKERFSNTLNSMASANRIAEQIRFYENVGENPLDFLSVNLNNSEYNITINRIDKGERVFGVQYLLKARSQPSQ